MTRKRVAAALVVLAVVVVPVAALASSAPPGATALCRDGTYSYSQHRSGTCSHHGGVARWLDATTTSSGIADGSDACGVERWAVKTLQDRPRLLPPISTTVRYLITRPAPNFLPATRLPFERHLFTVTAAIVLVRPEADSDLHLVLQSGGDEMIAEAPSPACDSQAVPLRRRQMTAARSHVRLCARARITGVAFFDYDHGQTGVAPNAIELHPILAFRCLT